MIMYQLCISKQSVSQKLYFLNCEMNIYPDVMKQSCWYVVECSTGIWRVWRLDCRGPEQHFLTSSQHENSFNYNYFSISTKQTFYPPVPMWEVICLQKWHCCDKRFRLNLIRKCFWQQQGHSWLKFLNHHWWGPIVLFSLC